MPAASHKISTIVRSYIRITGLRIGFQLGGIVGHNFLKKYRVAIDFERSVLRLKDIS